MAELTAAEPVVVDDAARRLHAWDREHSQMGHALPVRFEELSIDAQRSYWRCAVQAVGGKDVEDAARGMYAEAVRRVTWAMTAWQRQQDGLRKVWIRRARVARDEPEPEPEPVAPEPEPQSVLFE